MSIIIENLLRKRISMTAEGKVQSLSGGISLQEAQVIQKIIKAHELSICIETGVAHGVSTLAICEALAELPSTNDKQLYGIDPSQFSEHHGIAVRLLKDHGFSQLFTLLEGPTHLEAPMLLKAGKKVDFAFIDGFHTFDYSLIDFFFMDKLLRVGGFLMIHDLPFPAKKKLIRYILTHRRYELVRTPELEEGVKGRIVRRLRSIKHRESYWSVQFAQGANMGVFRKIDDFEPDWHFFQNF